MEAKTEELHTALWIVCFHLRHGNDLLALDRLKGFDVRYYVIMLLASVDLQYLSSCLTNTRVKGNAWPGRVFSWH